MNPLKKLTLLTALAGSLVSSASAVYVEDFEAAFPAWESGWLGTNSNLQNIYGVGAGRGNNPDGLWVQDGLSLFNETRITFNNAFGLTLTSLSVDVATWVNLTFEIFDSSGATLGSWGMAPNQGAYTDPGTYVNFSTTSNTGIGGFRFLGSGIEGNTSIDNVIANGGGQGVPDGSSTLILGGLGLAALATFRRRCAA